MPYTKQTWQDNNTAYPVSAARLNYIENGIAAAQSTADTSNAGVTNIRDSFVFLDDYLPAGWVSGVTDVTAQVQQWITAAEGKKAVGRPGTFIVTGGILIGSNTDVDGGGLGCIFKRPGTAAAGYETIFTNSNNAAFGNNKGITIQNMTIDASEGTSNHPYNNPIHMRYVDGLLVTGCRIRGGGASCHVEACSAARILGNQIDSFTDKAIGVNNAAGFGGTNLTNPEVIVANNTIRQTAASKHAAGSSPLLATQAGTVFHNNIVVSTVALNGFGVELGDANGAVVQGNTFIGCGILVGSGSRSVIKGNTLLDGAVQSSARIQVQVTGAAPNPSRVTIQDNKIHNIATAAPSGAISIHSSGTFSEIIGNSVSGGGYIDVRASDCVLRDNVVEGAYQSGFYVASCARPYIANNLARNCGIDPAGANTTKVGYTFDSLTDPTIVNNIAQSSNAATADMRHGYYMNASTGVRWRDNDSRGHTTGIFTFSGTPTWDNTETYPQVASAATITLPGFARNFLVTGTTSITSITATGWAGQTVTLVFNNTLTVTDGGNLLLNGNFVTTAADTLTLFCDGGNWSEVARSVN